MVPRKSESGRTALVLGGGAARGFAHVGLLKALEAEGICFDMIVGTSMGAMIGGLYAAGIPVSEIERSVVDMPWKSLVRYFKPDLRHGGLITGKSITMALRALLGDADIADFKTPFACVAADVLSGERIVFQSGDAVMAIRASISIPGTFAPVVLDGRTLVDGGILEPVPVPTAREMGATLVVAENVLDHPAKRVLAGRWAATADELRECAPSRRRTAENGGWYDRLAAYAQGVSRRRKEKRRAKGRAPWIGTVVWHSWLIQQYSLSEYQTRQADLLIEPVLGDMLPSEFYRGGEAVEAGLRAGQAAIPEIRKLISRAK
jgi:NTE family protein